MKQLEGGEVWTVALVEEKHLLFVEDELDMVLAEGERDRDCGSHG
jgi:hypothetical protein